MSTPVLIHRQTIIGLLRKQLLMKKAELTKFLSYCHLIAVSMWIGLLSGCGGDSPTTQPSGVVKYGPAPKESYAPKIGRYGGQIVAIAFVKGGAPGPGKPW